jgi:hypothetical protein
MANIGNHKDTVTILEVTEGELEEGSMHDYCKHAKNFLILASVCIYYI